MKVKDKSLDYLMLSLGLLLLVLFWARFPAMPSMDGRSDTAYVMPDAIASSSAKWTFLKPAKSFSPQQVVHIQLQALKQNDRSDSGVITVFNFSSPQNKRHIGPINHLRMLVRGPAYQSMLNFKSCKRGQVVVTGDTAYQLVLIEGRDGRQEAYMFILSKQRIGAYKGCWMTDGIARMDQEALLSLT